ncbi:hypothetical protein [Glaciihabitans sp. UYNi722]|uniref:hypothetical protein n=1 Tax=Glaciihabitans sp. UYNi722 TaxID=3156344 RepID=UPI0033972A76
MKSSTFVLRGVKSEYTAPSDMPAQSRKMRRASTYVNLGDDWTYWVEAEHSERIASARTLAFALVMPSSIAHQEHVSRLVARNAASAPIASTAPDLVLASASPNSPNTSLAAHSNAVGLEAITR